MPSSDSEDFESADEGQGGPEKKGRKNRLSSSNYSENTLESDQEIRKTPTKTSNVVKPVEIEKKEDGWDDFDIDDNEEPKQSTIDKKDVQDCKNSNVDTKKKVEDNVNKESGWDDFDDWGQDDDISNAKVQPKQAAHPDPEINAVTEKLASASTASTGGWGWGWSVDSLLSTATAGISTITSQVSQGISTVLESSIGAPDPEELARKTAKENEDKSTTSSENTGNNDGVNRRIEAEQAKGSSDAAFPFGSLISGVTKFVETTGTKVISGGLDTLETIGKKTMEVLQDGDPGLAKKRAMLGLDPGDKPVLSQVLREAKAKAEEEDKYREEKREAKEVHYENLFDDFEGLVHLEALEMLSRQVSMKIEERLRALNPDKRQDVKETMQQVAELCEMPEEEDDDDTESAEGMSKPDAFHEKLQTATQDLGLKLQFQSLVKQYTEILDWISTADSVVTDKAVYKRAVSGLAQGTALSVELYHKAGEMLLVKSRRSTADEADALTQMTVVLTKHISELATLFTEKLNTISTENKENVNNYITNIFLEAENSSTYIQNAFHLALPILQIGAV